MKTRPGKRKMRNTAQGAEGREPRVILQLVRSSSSIQKHPKQFFMGGKKFEENTEEMDLHPAHPGHAGGSDGTPGRSCDGRDDV